MLCQKWQHVRGQQLFHPSVLPWHVDRRSSRLLPHNSQQSFVILSARILGRGEGGLTSRREHKSLLLRPPLFILEVDRKGGGGGGGGITAGQYGITEGVTEY